MTLRFVLVLAILLFSGCDVSDEEAKALRSAARNGQIPATLSSLEAAVTYKNATFAGGKIDEIRLGLSKYIVIFIHGSGVPVVEIAVYRRNIWHWELMSVRPPPTFGFLSAVASQGKIVTVVRGSTQTWPLYDPAGP